MAAPLFIPAVCMFGLEKIRAVPSGKLARLTLDMSLVFLNCYLAVPLSVAMFPKYGSIKSEDLEPEFQNVIGRNGQKIKDFLYNKGM